MPGLIFVEGRKRSFSCSSLVFCSLRLPVILVSSAIRCTFPSLAKSTRMEDTLHPVHIQTQNKQQKKKTTQKERWPISQLKIQFCGHFMAACEPFLNQSFRTAATCKSPPSGPLSTDLATNTNHRKEGTTILTAFLNIPEDWLYHPGGKRKGSSFLFQLGSYFASPRRGRCANNLITQ